uniref:Uncharacterized protein n=1 Tax=Caenorhabditis japonica TaxID=281687 RepID=A0A8R1IN36_CAEJA
MVAGRQLACTVDRSAPMKLRLLVSTIASPTASLRWYARLHSYRNSPTRRRKSLEWTSVKTT